MRIWQDRFEAETVADEREPYKRTASEKTR